MKKVISVVLMLVLSLTMCISGYAEEVTSEVTTSDKIEYLVSQGIPKDLVKNASTEIGRASCRERVCLYV